MLLYTSFRLLAATYIRARSFVCDFLSAYQVPGVSMFLVVFIPVLWVLSLSVTFLSRVFNESRFRWQLGITVENFTWISREGRCSYLQRHRSSPVLICRKIQAQVDGTDDSTERTAMQDVQVRVPKRFSFCFFVFWWSQFVALFRSARRICFHTWRRFWRNRGNRMGFPLLSTR